MSTSFLGNRSKRDGFFNVWARTVGVLLAVAFVVAEANAQAYPSRPVKIIVPFGAGSATDVTARLIADKLARIHGRNFVVENRTGAGGNPRD